MDTVKLYGYSTSPFVRKTGLCLYYKGIPFEFIPVNPLDNKEIAFTEQTKVPVLQIGNEWKLDSTEHARWLDELFPEKPLLGKNDDEGKQILALDKWITDYLIHSSFSSIHNKKESNIIADTMFRHVAWRLAAIVSSQTPLPEEIRNAWPQILKAAPFIKRIAKETEELEEKTAEKPNPKNFLKESIGSGQFLGGLNEPSLADFAAYQHFVFNYAVGIGIDLSIAEDEELKKWIFRVKDYLPENPLLVPDYIIVNKL